MVIIPNISDAPGDSSWLSDAATQQVFAAIRAGGFEARAVGGAVRNTLMGRAVNDIDLATDALPQDVIRLSKAVGLKVHETGMKHGTVTVMAGNVPIEVTTLRKDVATDGRHADVSFTDDWAGDAARRDFTINALYCDAEGNVFDPLNGYPDISACRVRFIGVPTERIREDFLRILRFFRFSAIFGNGNLDVEGLGAVIRERHGLRRISAERISAELMKTLVAVHAQPIVEAMAQTGILSAILATAPQTMRLRQLVAAEEISGLAPDALRRLAALAVYAVDDGPRLAKRLRLSNEDRVRLMAIGDVRQFDISSPAAVRAALYRLGGETFTDLALVKAAIDREPASACDPVGDARTWFVPVLPVTGDDLLTEGISPGPGLGDILRAMEEAWIASDFTLERDTLLALLPAIQAQRIAGDGK